MSRIENPLEGRRTPLELGAEEFAEIGHRLVDDIAGLLGSMRDRPLSSGESPEQIRAALDATAGLPEEGTDASEVVADATRLLLDHSVFNGHPRFFGYVSSSPAPIGLLGDLLAAAVNPNVGAWALSPMAAEIEAQAVRWMAELVGYPGEGGGVLVSGGNVANMLGFWAARAAKAGWDVRQSGMRADAARQLTAYCAKGTHTWIQKAVDLSGMGAESARWIDTDDDGRLSVEALRGSIEADLEAGHRPFLVVGTAGSVGIGAVDPLPRLREVCDEHDVWFHVDGAYGAFAAAASNTPDDLRALALADSVALDPHKWLYAPLEAGCTLVRDPEALLRAFSYRPDYYAFDEGGVNYFEHGIQNSRGFRALKVWMALRQAGRSGYARMIEEDIELARSFHAIADAHPELEALTRGLSITTYRYVPEDLVGRAEDPEVAAYLNELNRTLRDRMELGGNAFVSNAVIGDVYALRMCVVNFRTTLEDVHRLADLTAQLGTTLDREMRPQGAAV
jgi:glutamate/tyrosine decarboxylase-like PLP-dependent enzyme